MWLLYNNKAAYVLNYMIVNNNKYGIYHSQQRGSHEDSRLKINSFFSEDSRGYYTYLVALIYEIFAINIVQENSTKLSKRLLNHVRIARNRRAQLTQLDLDF